MRMRKKKNLLPRMERCGAYQIKDPYERKGRWHDLMPEAKEIRVELGCGKGRFTVETAAAEPTCCSSRSKRCPTRWSSRWSARRRQSCTTSSSSTSTPTSCPNFRCRRGRPHLCQLLRPVASQAAGQAPADARQFLEALPQGAQGQRPNSFQDRQRPAV